ncbi:MAG: LSM domain-containing protein [Methermicoccaceae archaeon]
MFPIKAVQSHLGKKIQVEMKGDVTVLEGTLEGVDQYMNMHLEDTVELIDDERKRMLGSVIIRGNNIVMISPVEQF